MSASTQPICGPCTRERADVVRHSDPCEISDDDEYFAIKLGRVQTDLFNTLEDLRACIVTARHQHRVIEAQVLDEIRINVEQESRAAILVGR